MTWALLWGGPMDGERVPLGDGEPPARVGICQATAGHLVPVFSPPPEAAGVTVYEHATVAALQLFAAWRGHLDAHVNLNSDPDAYLYLHRDMVSRWLAGDTP